MPDHSLFRLRILPWCIALAMSGSYSSVWAEDDIQFDSRFLELKGDTKIDLKRFSSQGYVEPGKYNLQVQLNKQPLAEEYDIYWYAGEDDASKSYACLTPELVAQFGLKEDVAKNLQWSHDAKCLKSGQLEGMEIKADLSQSALVISLPQAYLEYTYPDWDPPSRWDDGISGIVADYSINAQTRHEENGGDDSNEISGNGTVGVNLGPWRMRADWQTNYQHTRSNDDDEFSGDETQKKWEWSRYYAWRALPSLKAKLALGEERGEFNVLLANEWLASALESQPVATVSGESWYFFGHCTEVTALPGAPAQWAAIFARFGAKLENVSVGCCGMAGTYGHEAKNHKNSLGIYELSWHQAMQRLPRNRCLATGYSCRSQVKRVEGTGVRHPVQALLEIIK